MTSSKEGCLYIVVIKPSALLRKIKLKHNDNSYCLIDFICLEEKRN